MAIISYADAYKKHLEEQKNADKKDVGLTRKYSLESGNDPGADIILGTLFMNPAKVARGVASATGKEMSEGAKKAVGIMSTPRAKVEQGFFGAAEGITDFFAGIGAQAVGQKEAAKWVYDHSWAQKAVGADVTDEFVGEDIASSTGYRLASDLLSGVGNVGFQIAIGSLIGGALSAPLEAGTISEAGAKAVQYLPLFFSAAGSGTAENYEKSGRLGWRENLGGVLKGGLEVATEIISPTGRVLDRALYGKTMQEANKYLVKHAIAKGILSSFVGEFGEEAASYAGGWAIENALGISKEKFSVKDMLYQGLMGGITGALFAAPNDVALVRTARNAGKKTYAQGEAYVRDKINEGRVEIARLKEFGNADSNNVKLAESALNAIETDETLDQKTREYYMGLAQQSVMREELNAYMKLQSALVVEQAKADPAQAQKLADALNAVVNEAGGKGEYKATDFTDPNSGAVRLYAVGVLGNDFLSASQNERTLKAILDNTYMADEYTGSAEQTNAIRNLKNDEMLVFKVDYTENGNAYAVVARQQGVEGDANYTVGYTTYEHIKNADGKILTINGLTADAAMDFLGQNMSSADIDEYIKRDEARQAQGQTAEPKTEPKPETKPKKKKTKKTEPKPTTKNEPKPNAEPKPKPPKKTETPADPPAEPKAETPAEPKTETSPATTEGVDTGAVETPVETTETTETKPETTTVETPETTETTAQTAQTEQTANAATPEDLSSLERRMMPTLGFSTTEFSKEEWTQARKYVPSIDRLSKRSQANVLTLVRTAQGMNLDEKYVEGLARMSSVFGFGIIFNPNIQSKGFCVRSDGMVVINPRSIDDTIGHEIWHTIDQTKDGDFRADAINTVRRIVGEKAFDAAKEDYKKRYEAQFGESLSAEELDGEAAASVVGNYLANMSFVGKFAKANLSLCRGIISAVSTMKAKWATAKAFAKENDTTAFAEYRKMNRIERLLMDELNSRKIPVYPIGDFDVSYSVSEWERMKENHGKYLTKKGLTINLDAAHAMIDTIVEEMREYANILPQDRIGKTLVGNASYGGMSVDNTTICPRTLAYNEFIDRVQAKTKRPLTQMESFLASQMLVEIATDPQCLYCYVALDRKAYNEYLLRYFERRDAVIKEYREMTDKSDEAVFGKIKRDKNGNPVVGKKNHQIREGGLYAKFLGNSIDTENMENRFRNWIGLANSGETLLKPEDVATEDRKARLINDPTSVLGQQFADAHAYAQGASQAKVQHAYVAYFDDILKLSDRTIKKLNKHYGLRWYSFSDYSGAFIAENMQQVVDAAIRGLKGLAYTKDTDFAAIFAPTGMGINISVFVTQDENGNFVVDEKQSAKLDEAIKLRNKYKNVGIVVTAATDDAVVWSMQQEWSDVVIPFHIVRTGQEVAEFYNWMNYTHESGDTVRDQDLWDSYQKMVGSKRARKLIYPSEHNNDYATYMRLCQERGLKPRFERFSKMDGITHEQYMKLVNETRLSASETSPLKAEFDLEAAKESFQKFVEKGGYWGSWYKDDADVEAAAERVAQDVLAGKKANEVEYGRQDKFNPEDLMRARKKVRQHGISQSPADISYSVPEVNPVQPRSSSWQRSKTTEEVKQKYPNLWDVAADESEVRNPTQVTNTVNSYRKVYDYLKSIGFTGTILDASSGLGLGTWLGIDEYGFDVEDIEPFPDKTYKPKYTDYATLDKKYDVIISNAVLNVLPQDIRDGLVVKMGELLAPGGYLFVNTRGEDVMNASSKEIIDQDNLEVYISKTGSYQKGFRKGELVSYLKDALGSGYTVAPANFFGKAAAVVQRKRAGISYSPVSEKANAEYMRLAKEPEENKSRLRELVEQAAKASGYNSPILYHGTNAFGFTVIDSNAPGADGYSFWASDNERTSGTYTQYNEVRDVFSDISEDDLEKKIEETSEELDDAIDDFRSIFDRTFSEWYFGMQDNEYIRNAVDNANPEAGNGDGVYDVLDDMIVNAWYDYRDQFAEYEDIAEWEESEQAQKLYAEVVNIESICKKIHDFNDIIGGIYRLYANTTNMYVVDAKGEVWNNLHPEGLPNRVTAWSDNAPYRTRDVANWARKYGYRGVIFKNVRDNGPYGRTPPSTVYAFFYPQQQLKSADLVTYDGYRTRNVVPLTERFNKFDEDIRYSPSSPNTSGRVVTQAKPPRQTITEKITNAKGQLNRQGLRNALKEAGSVVEGFKVLTVNAQQAVENQLVLMGMTKSQAGAVMQYARSARSHSTNAAQFKLADMTGEIRSDGFLKIIEPYLAKKGEVYDAVDQTTGETRQYTAKGGELAGKLYDEFQDYYAMLHALDRAAVGKNPYSGMSVDEMKAWVEKHEKAHPDFKAAAEKLSAFNSALLDIEAQAGIRSQETVDLWKKQYPHYVPMYVQEDGTIGRAPVRGSRNMEVRRDNAVATESDHRVNDALQNYLNQLQRRIRAAKFNLVLQEVYNSADGVSYEQVGDKKVWSVRYLEIGKDGKEQIVEVGGFKSKKEAQIEYLKHQDNRVNKNVVRGDIAEFEAKNLREQESAYLDNPEMENDPVEAFRKVQKGRKTVNEVSFYMDGKRVTMAVSDRIYTGLADLSGVHSSVLDLGIVKFVSKINDTFKKLVTNWNPFFAVKNIARDLQDGLLNSKFGMGEFLNMYRKNAEMMTTGKYSKEWELFIANGCLEASIFSDEFNTLAKSGKSGLEQATGVVGQFQHIKNFNTLTEALPRFTEFCLTLKHGGTIQQAIYNAADVTVNFSRSGVLTRVLNKTVSPFLNPAVQGLDRVIRLFTEEGIKNNKALASLLLKAVLLAIVPMALGNAMYGNDDEYKDMKDSVKENNYLFKIGDTWLKLPRGRVVSTISGLFNRSYKQLTGQETDWGDYGKNVLDQITPAQNVARHIGSPFMDVANNRTWYGTKIESDALQNYAVNQRYDENTSRISVWIGQLTSHFGLSPKEVNYLIDQYTGVVGDILLPTTTPAGTKGVVSYNFTVDPNTSSNLSNRFYDLYNKTMYKSNDGDVEAFYLKKRLDETKSAVSELFKQIKTINASSELSNKEKVKQASAIRASINQLYKTALDDRRLYEQNIKDALAIENSYAVEKITAQSAKRYGLDSDAVGKYALTFGGDFVKQYDTEAQANDYKADASKKTVYAEANRLTYGAEYALREYNVNVYDKAKTLNELGISYDEYYNYYMTARYYSGKTKKDKILAYLNGSGLSKSQIALMMYYSGYSAYADEAKKAIKASSLSAERKKELLAGLTN